MGAEERPERAGGDTTKVRRSRWGKKKSQRKKVVGNKGPEEAGGGKSRARRSRWGKTAQKTANGDRRRARGSRKGQKKGQMKQVRAVEGSEEAGEGSRRIREKRRVQKKGQRKVGTEGKTVRNDIPHRIGARTPETRKAGAGCCWSFLGDRSSIPPILSLD